MKRCKKEIFCGFMIPLIFVVIVMLLKTFFEDNAYPVDYEYIDSFDWTSIFMRWYFTMSAICIILNGFLIPFLGTKANLNSQNAWLMYAVISLILALIAPVYITVKFREDSMCTWIMYLLFLLQYALTFLISTKNAPRHWDFFPAR